MTAMARILAAAVMVLTVTANPYPAPQGHGVIRDPACDSICAFTEPPFDNAICYEVKLDNGKCKAVFINPKAGKLDSDNTDGTIFAGIEVKHTQINVDKNKNKGTDATVEAIETNQKNEAAIVKGNTTPITKSDGNSPLSKRLSFERSDKGEKVCHNQSSVCYDRDQMAKTEDCEGLLRFWSKTHGRWVISDRDLAGRHWLELMVSGSCVFAVGHPTTGGDISPIKGRESSLGNLDIVGLLMQSIPQCDKSGGMEVRGVIQCDAFDLVFWVVGKGSFDCCRGDEAPGRSMGKF
ncbi:hypothetical protein CI238_00297 [Colletotrichum incanum]|uniref:Ecp2 effector protein-like domain-containing protein n=1 Tax=Colletotrichum incanum TaxID=1573173 RepID=A0A161WAN2_COLIC|nr:hypothetical protein CI238_00297 [Colletotrichum incanum]